MNTKELTYLFQNPSLITKEHTENLEKIIKEFPYFQPVRALLLKGLKENEDFRYNQELKTTAAYTTDRSVLFDFITSELFDTSTPDPAEKKSKNDIDVVDPQEIKALSRMSMDDAVDMNIEEAEEVLDPSLFSSKDAPTTTNVTMVETIIEQSEKGEIDEVFEEDKKATETVLEIDKPLDFDKKESHSFAEWLKLTSTLPIDRTTDTTINSEDQHQQTENETPNKQEHKFHLIDEFIANNPKIKPAEKNAPSRNLANEHMVAPDELMTETLARVYLAQKKYKKAIQAYKILILKNPEKSGFFADQIRAIKKLQENK